MTIDTKNLALVSEEDLDTSHKIQSEIKIELIKHLSKEVEMAQNQLIAQRSKNNLLVAFGPYLALGLLWANVSLVAAFQKVTSTGLIFFSCSYIVSYIFLGVLAARIEAKFWDQANQWRAEIAQLSNHDSQKLVFSANHLTTVYVAIYFGSALVLMSILWAIYLMK